MVEVLPLLLFISTFLFFSRLVAFAFRTKHTFYCYPFDRGALPPFFIYPFRRFSHGLPASDALISPPLVLRSSNPRPLHHLIFPPRRNYCTIGGARLTRAWLSHYEVCEPTRQKSLSEKMIPTPQSSAKRALLDTQNDHWRYAQST
ncbi:hypothetical protein BJV78DRAFT_1236834 [Lactifluus subvellereus]|nr:hypothetical protein BJV78DRAFT_1236834 [Lactifluus subvellereus]